MRSHCHIEVRGVVGWFFTPGATVGIYPHDPRVPPSAVVAA